MRARPPETRSARVWAFVLDDATTQILPDLLDPQADHIRLFQHYPRTEITWWQASVPLRHDAPNRDVLVNRVSLDVEMPRERLLAYLDDFRDAGMDLVQTVEPLPSDVAPHRFRSRRSYLNLIARFGGRLLFELPHRNETARAIFFREEDVDRFRGTAIGARARDSDPGV